MVQYIDKATVVEEIKKKLDKHSKLHTFNYEAVKDLESLWYFLDTLEVKEEVKDADLDRGIEKELDTRWYGEYLDTDKFKESAKYFFELGLKAQKGK